MEILEVLTKFLDDEAYYTEMAQNNEYIMRVRISEIYKAAATQFMLQALFMYLEWKQEKELGGTFFGQQIPELRP